MNILLVEPDYDRPASRYYFPAMALMRLSSYYKEVGADNIDYIRGMGGYFNKNIPDKICITSLFTWETDRLVDTINYYKGLFPKAEIEVGGIAASLMKDYIKEKTGIDTVFGIQKWLEEYPLDYSLYPDLDYSVAYTTRGCPNKCQFCIVSKIEPEYEEINNWKELYYNPKLPTITFCDNNFLACTDKHFTKVMNEIKEINKPYDFNQALDARLFTKKHAKVFAKTRIEPMRFAFDTMATEGHIQRAIVWCYKSGIQSVVVLMLYCWKDTPEELYYRLYEMNKLYVSVFPMRFMPHDALNREYIGEHWTKGMLNNFKNILHNHYNRGMVGRSPLSVFKKAFGNNAKEFMDKLEGDEKGQTSLI